jgi:hypothetical protein
MKFRKKNPMNRLTSFPLDGIITLLLETPDSDSRVQLGGDFGDIRVKNASYRLVNFKIHGVKCIACGIEGKFFAAETGMAKSIYEQYHLNLYGYDDFGDEVLMTSDHIVPLSRGGKNGVENMQTMCKPCNEKKGARV